MKNNINKIEKIYDVIKNYNIKKMENFEFLPIQFIIVSCNVCECKYLECQFNSLYFL